LTSHQRPLTYPALVELLKDGEWHADEELAAITQFPREWLHELEREGHAVEQQGDSPLFVRMLA
jgi:hypothetical protein